MCIVVYIDICATMCGTFIIGIIYYLHNPHVICYHFMQTFIAAIWTARTPKENFSVVFHDMNQLFAHRFYQAMLRGKTWRKVQPVCQKTDESLSNHKVSVCSSIAQQLLLNSNSNYFMQVCLKISCADDHFQMDRYVCF